jgi:hypothetical protein
VEIDNDDRLPPKHLPEAWLWFTYGNYLLEGPRRAMPRCGAGASEVREHSRPPSRTRGRAAPAVPLAAISAASNRPRT